MTIKASSQTIWCAGHKNLLRPALVTARGDLHLDEHLATVCAIEDGIETYLSDVDGMDAFFSIRLPNLTSES